MLGINDMCPHKEREVEGSVSGSEIDVTSQIVLTQGVRGEIEGLPKCSRILKQIAK